MLKVLANILYHIAAKESLNDLQKTVTSRHFTANWGLMYTQLYLNYASANEQIEGAQQALATFLQFVRLIARK